MYTANARTDCCLAEISSQHEASWNVRPMSGRAMTAGNLRKTKRLSSLPRYWNDGIVIYGNPDSRLRTFQNVVDFALKVQALAQNVDIKSSLRDSEDQSLDLRLWLCK